MKENILIVDDEDRIRRLIAALSTVLATDSLLYIGNKVLNFIFFLHLL